MTPTPVILDVDTGVDDALALLLAVRSPDLDVRAVTCVAGNTDVDQVLRNTWTRPGLVTFPWLEVPTVRCSSCRGTRGRCMAPTAWPTSACLTRTVGRATSRQSSCCARACWVGSRKCMRGPTVRFGRRA